MNQAVKVNKQPEKEMAERFLDPTNDVAFKKIFTTEEHKPLLISFLNAILRLKEEDWIEYIEFMPQEEAPLIDGGKKVVFDVKCKDRKNHEYVVEMQNRKLPEFIKRSQYYISHCYVSQIGRGTPYFKLRPVVLVAISNYNLFETTQEHISYHQVLDVKTLHNHLKDMSYVFVELPKFTKTATELSSVEDQWLYLLKHANEEKEVPKTIVSKEILEAYHSLERFSWSEGDYDAYIRSSIALTDEYHGQQVKFREGEKKGRVEGLEKGRVEGLEKGRVEGLEKGREEEKKQIALKMLQRNRSIQEIIEDTGLTAEQINQLNP